MSAGILILQLAIILATTHLVGRMLAAIGQPRVIGEMAAGIMLGPSLFGLIAPHAWATLFPPSSLHYLNYISQAGVIVFLFLVGLELDLNLLLRRGRAAIIISNVSIALPYLLGLALACYLWPRLQSRAPTTRFSAWALFMGAAMSVTAFPVLARILKERRLENTMVGVVSLTCAAVDDVSAWCILAFVIAVTKSTGLRGAAITTGMAAAYAVLMILVGRRILQGLATSHRKSRRVTPALLLLVLGLLAFSSLATDYIGVHALFGAFLIGVAMPKDPDFVHAITSKLSRLTLLVLLPVFFAYAGLKTRIDMLNNTALWTYTLLIILVACAGKFGGSALAARLCGMSWRESAVIGTLMNTRGLMELVILNVGRELGVIGDTVYSMMVLMALVTTGMTTPLLQMFYPMITPASEASPPAVPSRTV